MSAETILYTSCTPHRPRTRYHIVFEDFEEIGVDIYNAHALRAFEVATNQRIRQLREAHGLPETRLPHTGDLWIPMPYRALEALTLKAVTKSTCQRILAEEAVEDAPPSLIELGFLRRRFAARRTNESRKSPLTTVYKDDDGEFILVDEGGNFIDMDGVERSAMMYGFCLVERQYLYCIEAVNAAIAALDGLEPPQPMPRWDEPMMRRCTPPRRQKGSVAAKKTAQETTISYDVHHDANNRRLAQGGTNPYNATSVNAHDSTDSEGMSRAIAQNPIKMEKPVKQPRGPLYRNTIDLTALRCAPWTPETLLGLASLVLDIPARPADDDDEEALRQWVADWLEPAGRLYNATLDLSPQLAWERVDLTSRYMATQGSPSWWQRGPESGLDWRKTKDLITLRNVAKHYFIQYADFDRHRNQWWPEQTTPYDGPPLEYEAGYEGVEPPAPVIEAEAAAIPDGHVETIAEIEELTLPPPDQATESSEEPRGEPTTDEVIAVPPPVPRTRRVGMTADAVVKLAKEIQGKYPGLILGYREVASERWMVKIHLDERRRFNLDLVGWYCPTPEIQARIEEALRYAASLESGGTSPPQEVESEETNETRESRADHRSGGLSAPLLPEAAVASP